VSIHLTQDAIDRVNLIAAKNGGRITHNDVLADARKKTSPLHNLFEWDDAKAAELHRLETARAIIREVRIEVTVDSKIVRAVAYVRDPAMAEDNAPGYISVSEARKSPEDAGAVLAMELRRVEQILTRAVALADVLGLRKDADTTLARVSAFRSRVDRKRVGGKTVSVASV
jgi:hypothetical protein